MSGQNLPQDRFPKRKMIEIIEAASGVSVVWDTEDRPQLGQDPTEEWAWIELGVSTTEDIGWDEQRTEQNDKTNPPTQETITIGHRQATVNLMAYSFDPELEALDLCGRVRMAFNRTAIHNMMVPTISLRWCEKANRLPHDLVDGRLRLRANMDIAINYVVAADTDDVGTKEYLLSVSGVTGTLTP